ncbi:BlaI/MecI/CopY family transcriptional regulator [Aerococcaceae bacterium NML191292]|nr:BlaI/MecI/CopY family transcriptional regulator [Aerococcaceae bacterium NML210727]MCW6654412.1 BlaI/MecI/CopY family transcriptional regulator [Aerococcaceae bacterium NML201296]MCW6659041.1 BlaI/MecI/CopY family transcriptional regulator [Aerococcaceae bacterium NML191292]MCW6660801.1 BlaI/MecI/CopY family transcriptional regulator [Aerococcaceae bacterium NML201209]MCW6662374.1 BlaI/MecI/CopY family transcriptional regulator [Aerococcaceae bacterium NML190073]
MTHSIKRLPDAEFSVMKAIWSSQSPVGTHTITEKLKTGTSWKPQTLLTMLTRLTEKGFLVSERKGRERLYTPIITENEYLQIETGDFLKRYEGNSIGSLVKTLCASQELSAEDLDELRNLLKEG